MEANEKTPVPWWPRQNGCAPWGVPLVSSTPVDTDLLPIKKLHWNVPLLKTGVFIPLRSPCRNETRQLWEQTDGCGGGGINVDDVLWARSNNFNAIKSSIVLLKSHVNKNKNLRGNQSIPKWTLLFFFLTLYTQQRSYFFPILQRKQFWNEREQAGNQKRYNLQGLQKWKPKPSRTIGNKVDIYIIYVIFASTSKK